MHWTRGCKEIILSIDADTTFLIYDGNGDNDDDYTDAGIEMVDDYVIIMQHDEQIIKVNIAHSHHYNDENDRIIKANITQHAPTFTSTFTSTSCSFRPSFFFSALR